MAASKLSLKLVIDKKSKKVLFAEAGKETVDFLCNILILPVGTVIRLLLNKGKVGCLSNLYQSIENLNEGYIQPNQPKDTVLKPMAAASFIANSLTLPFQIVAPPKQVSDYFVFRCGQNSSHLSRVSTKSGTPCVTCCLPMNSYLTVSVDNSVGEVPGCGFVKGMVTYMVMDDLAVVPLSTSTLFSRFNGLNVSVCEEKVVDLNLEKALKLLELSFQSKDVLTTVFKDEL